MTVPPSFPTLPGQGWSVHKRPAFSTRVVEHVSGRQVVAALYAQTLYEFELTIDGLDLAGAFAGLGQYSLQTLMGFYLGLQGRFGTFLFTDPTDNSVTNQILGYGDGTTTIFPLMRTVGATTELSPPASSYPKVYLDGVLQTSGWSLTSANAIQFTSAPATYSTITATFTYAFNCRFLDDQEDFENFMNGLWRVQTLKFRSTKGSQPWFPISYYSLVPGLPTSDPATPGDLWNDGGLIAISDYTSPFIALPTSPILTPWTVWNNGGVLSVAGYTLPVPVGQSSLPTSLPGSTGVFWCNGGAVSLS